MNFDKWINSDVKYFNEETKYNMERGWDACKKEILKILEENIEEIRDGDVPVLRYIDEKIIQEIKKKI